VQFKTSQRIVLRVILAHRLAIERTAVATLEGSHVQGAAGRRVGYRVEYEAVANTIHFHADFDSGASYEGEFDFDPSKLDAAAAVDAFMHVHIEKADRDVAP
jgi:hypothetical protein